MPPQQNRWRGGATATMGRTSSTTAKCAANQAIVDILVKKRQEPRAADTRYGFTLAKAMRTLVDSKEPITTYAQALELKGVGPHVAQLLFPKCPTRSTAAASKTTKKKASTATAEKKKPAAKKKAPPNAAAATTSTSNATSTVPTAKRKQPPAASSSFNDSDTASAATAVSAKQRLYQEAKARAEQQHFQRKQYQQGLAPTSKDPCGVCGGVPPYYDNTCAWKAVLLIDGRERQSKHVVSKCIQAGIPCEERHLPIGDMTWIAVQDTSDTQFCTCDPKSSEQPKKKKKKKSTPPPPTEVLLGTIIERKTQDDWLSSMFGSRRYNEQRLRLKEAGQPQVLFILEGGGSTSTSTMAVKHKYKETLTTAVMATRLHYGFSIVRTKHLDDTVTTLQRLHRRILQRTFPQAFGSFLGDTTASSTTSSQPQQNSQQQPFTLSQDSTSSEQQRLPVFVPAMAAGRKRSASQAESPGWKRRRKQSLQEMTFDTLPVPPLGTERFMTYEELKTKTELSRELASRSVGHIHAAMVKQVSTFSQAKVNSITQVYPTLSSLLRAYTQAAQSGTGDDTAEESRSDAGKTLVADVPIVNAITSSLDEETVGRAKKIGPRSSEELHIAFGILDEHAGQLPAAGDGSSRAADSDNDENRKPAAIPTPPASATSSASVEQRRQPQQDTFNLDDSVVLLEDDSDKEQETTAAVRGQGAATAAAASTTATGRPRTRAEEDAWLWESSRDDDDSPLGGSRKSSPPTSQNENTGTTAAAASKTAILLNSSTDDDDDEESPASAGLSLRNQNQRSQQQQEIIEIDL